MKSKFFRVCICIALCLCLFTGVFAVMGWGSLLRQVGSTVMYPFSWLAGGGVCGILTRYPRPAGGKRRPARRESVSPRGTSGRGNSGKREQLAVPLPLHEAGAGGLVAGVLRRDRDRVVGRQRGAVLRHPADAQPRQLLRRRRGNAGGV